MLRTSVILLLFMVTASSKHPCPESCTCDPSKRHVVCDGKKSGQKLMEIPQDIPTDTVYLRFVNNDICTLTKNTFKALTQLRNLYLCNNGIEHIERDAFIGLSQVERLDLSSNKLSYLSNRFPDTFSGLERLEELRLDNTELREIPDIALAKLPKLVILTLEQNKIVNSTLGLGFQTLRCLKQLSISQNNFGRLMNNSFANIKQSEIERLHIKRCNITHIEEDTFKGLNHLIEFNLTSNPLTMSKEKVNNMLKPLCDARITTLGLGATRLKNIPEMFPCLKHLRHLDIQQNNLTTLRSKTFDFPHHLQSVNMEKNYQLVEIRSTALKGLNELRILNMHKCGLTRIPKFADIKGKSFVPNMMFLDLRFNLIRLTTPSRKHSPFIGLERVETIFLSHNDITWLTSKLLAPLQHIRALRFTKNRIKHLGDDTFRSLKTLKSLDLGENKIYLRPLCHFANMSNLEFLRLAGISLHEFNVIYRDYSFNPDCLFEGLSKLKTLDIGNTRLSDLPSTFFKHLHGLKKLIMDQNRISGWNDNIFENISALHYLGISVNLLQRINETSLQTLLPSLNHFQAYSNPYTCDCNLLWYVDWVRRMHAAKNFTLKIKSTITYRCRNLKDVYLLEFDRTFYQCHQILILSVSGASGFALLVLITVAVLYHNRWYLRYLMFLLRSRRTNFVDEQQRLIYAYDCFVTYSGEDSEWVTQKLLNKLEEDYSFQVCIHERDFKLGKAISENIVESIEHSRKVLIVLTQNFVRSEWCKFEVQLAHANTLHNSQKARQSLIILLMEDVPFDGMTPILRYLIRKKTFIEWTEEEPGQTLFWNRLSKAISGRTQHANLNED